MFKVKRVGEFRKVDTPEARADLHYGAVWAQGRKCKPLAANYWLAWQGGDLQARSVLQLERFGPRKQTPKITDFFSSFFPGLNVTRSFIYSEVFFS